MKIKKLGVLLLTVCCIFVSVGIQVFATGVGNKLPKPENGWRRYDDRNQLIKYKGEWTLGSYPETSYYLGTDSYVPILSISDRDSHNIKFKFMGSKFRIIGYQSSIGCENCFIVIDGVEYKFTQQSDTNIQGVLSYESPVLEFKEHDVELYSISNSTSKYGLVFDAIDIDEDGKLLDQNKPIDVNTLDIEPEKETIKQCETVSANLVIDNINEIVAEDIRINYDEEKLEFLGFEEVDGMKLIKAVEKTADGDLRVIVASEGESNIINAKEVLLKLKFKGIGTGEALVDITNGRVTDGIELEKDLAKEECGEATIVIEGLKDVNNSGEFTLLDLGIDARHFSKDPASSELNEYNTDIVVNGEIDDDDLLEIGRLILENPNYIPNN